MLPFVLLYYCSIILTELFWKICSAANFLCSTGVEGASGISGSELSLHSSSSPFFVLLDGSMRCFLLSKNKECVLFVSNTLTSVVMMRFLPT